MILSMMEIKSLYFENKIKLKRPKSDSHNDRDLFLISSKNNYY